MMRETESQKGVVAESKIVFSAAGSCETTFIRGVIFLNTMLCFHRMKMR